MKYSILVSIILGSISTFGQQDTSFKAYSQQLPASSVSFKMVPIPAGTYRLGAVANDSRAEKDEQPGTEVKISAFWMGANEVTYEEYFQFFNDVNYSQNTITDAVTRPSSPYIDMTLGMGKEGGFPANSMQQYGALMYCKWLYIKTGIFHRLPTEAEWEYACRAGAATIYPSGNKATGLGDYAWFKDNSENKYHKTGEKKPNAWGLYDMLGNVAEWVLDQYQPDFYSTLAAGTIDPVRKPEARNPRIVRGGSYADEAVALRVSDRRMSDPVWNRRDPQIPKSRWWNADAPFVGFRVIRPFQQPTPQEAETFFQTYLRF